MKEHNLMFYYLRMCRTENSIKNHWNCSVKKRLELRSHISDMESRKIKVGIRKTEVVRQSLDQIANLEKNVETCSLDLDLILGTPNGRESQTQSSDKGNCGWLTARAGANNIIKTTPRNVCYDRAAAACGLNVEGKQIYHNYGSLRDSHYLYATHSINACSTPSGDLWGFPNFHVKNHKLNDHLMSLLNNGLDAFDCNRRAGNFLKKPDRPVTVETSKGSQGMYA